MFIIHQGIEVSFLFNETTELLPDPKSSRARGPDSLAVGEYAYDNLSSADFIVGDFPVHDFVTCISGRSSYEMIGAIRGFYKSLPPPEDGGKAVTAGMRKLTCIIWAMLTKHQAYHFNGTS